MADRPCNQPQLEQISTGQAGVEINRDLEQIFRAVNKLIRCVSKLANYVDVDQGGGFDGGGGSGGGGGGGGGSTPIPPDPPIPFPNEGEILMSSGTDVVLPDGGGYAFIEATAAIAVTLGNPAFGRGWKVIQNTAAATHVITLKDNLGVTIGTLNPGQRATDVLPFRSAAGAPTWPTGVLVYSISGAMYTDHSIIFRDEDAGPTIKDKTNGEFQRLEVNAGTAGYNSEGATEPDL